MTHADKLRIWQEAIASATGVRDFYLSMALKFPMDRERYERQIAKKDDDIQWYARHLREEMDEHEHAC